MEYTSFNDLIKKIESVGLLEQKTKNQKDYVLKFYFSDKVKGNPIWWWDVFHDFFKDNIEEPSNLFNFAVLICYKKKNPEHCYIISLGKSHFYLNKFIEKDFGIKVAMRIADDEHILLKKSRYFAGNKKQELATYEKFIPGAYLPGESVENLKTKPSETEKWGSKNIIFSDSIQISLDKNPIDLVEVFNEIDNVLISPESNKLPKLNKIKDDEITKNLDDALLNAIKNKDSNVTIDEFRDLEKSSYHSISNSEYTIFTVLGKTRKQQNKTPSISNISIEDIYHYFEKFNIKNINTVKVEIKNEEGPRYIPLLRKILSFTHSIENKEKKGGSENYYLRDGDWYCFNSTFMDYLKKSLEKIPFGKKEPLHESDYLEWKEKKEKEIKSGKYKDKISYREYYFNCKIAKSDNGYILYDRKLKKVKSISDKNGEKDYKIEIADLYYANRLISVKISDSAKELIYNIEQSKSSMLLLQENKFIIEGNKIEYMVLWISTPKKIKKITEINSIQLLLAIQSWKEAAENLGLKTEIYYSHHNKQKKASKKNQKN